MKVWDARLGMVIERADDAFTAPARRLDAAMAEQGLDLTGSYRDDNGDGLGEFEVREYGDSDGRAYCIYSDGRIEETDR